MECLRTTRGLLSRYVDGNVPPPERERIERHLAACDSCADAAGEYRYLRNSLRELPRLSPSARLQTELRVLASREQSRRMSRLTLLQKWNTWRDRTALLLNNLMRPLMLPVAGGLGTAVILFGMLVPDFTVEFHPVRNDVPTVLFTQASVKESIPTVISESEVVLMLQVDESGRMIDYRVVTGQHLLQNDSVRRRLETTLLFTQFTPATSFGQPTAGQIRVSFRTNRIEVRG